MTKLQPYKKYYPVAYEYVTELPEGWQLLPNIAIFQERKERGTENEEILSISAIKGIVKSSDYENRKDRTSDDKSQYLLVKEGDLAYNTMLMWDGAVGYSLFRGIVSPAYTVLKSKMEINPKFFHYQMRNEFYKNYSRRFSYGIVDARLRLYYVHFKRMYSIVPPLSVQNDIVAYLDKKNAEIDKFIRNKERLVELLEERKSTFINDKLTDGMKNTSKSLSSNWLMKRVKHIAKVKGRIGFRGYTTNDIVEANGGALVLGATHISNSGKIILDEPVFISWSKYYESPEIMISINDLVMVQRGSTCGKVGIISENLGPSTINPSLVLFKNIRINPEFLFYSFKSNFVTNSINDTVSNTAIPMLSQEQIGNFVITVPVESYMADKIVEEIKEEIGTIDLAISKARQEISSIKEYREALITDLVTGRRRVPQIHEG